MSVARPRTSNGALASPALSAQALVLAALALFVLIYLVPLDHRPLFSPDELRYAEIPREMLARGDWVVPRLSGVRYFEKPPMGYWVNAVSLGWFGESRFGVRLPSAIAAGLTAVLVFFMTGAAGATLRVQLLACAIYLTFAEVYVVGTFNLLDSLLTLWLTAGIFFFYRAVATQNHSHGRWWALIAGVAFGCAFLTKGFLAFAVPGLVLLTWSVWSGSLRAGLHRGWICAAAIILVALPWAIAIHLREADFWRYFFWEEHIRRFLGDNAQHKENSLYFIKLLPLLALPWIFLLPATAAGLHRASARPRAVDFQRLLWLWCVLPFAFFSVSSGKLMTYILPCFPPFAALTALGLVAYLQSGRRKLFNYFQALIAGFFTLLLAALFILQQTAYLEALYAPGEELRVGLFAIGLICGAVFSVCAVFLTTAPAKLAFSVMSIVPLLAVTQFAMPHSLIERKAPGILLSPIAATVAADAIVVSDSATTRATAWYFKRPDAYTVTNYGELAYGLTYPDAAHRYLDLEAFRKLLDENAGVRDVVLVCKRSCPTGYEDLLPADTPRHEFGLYSAWHIPKG